MREKTTKQHFPVVLFTMQILYIKDTPKFDHPGMCSIVSFHLVLVNNSYLKFKLPVPTYSQIGSFLFVPILSDFL